MNHMQRSCLPTHPKWRSARRAATPRRAILILAVCALALGACSTQKARLQDTDQLAKSGKAFTESVPTLYDKFFDTTVEVDSIQLARQRDLALEIVNNAKPDQRAAPRPHASGRGGIG